MSRRIISLNDSNWRFGSVAQKPFRDTNDLREVREWLPAQVPGDVRLDLLRAGKIGDPFFAANNADSQWVDSLDWWYTRDVNLDLEQGERAFLIFEGIDYQSAVFFNGAQLGRHVGMFSRQIYELRTEDGGRTTKQKPDFRPSSLAIRIWGSDALPKLNRTLAQKFWARLVAPLYRPPEHPFPDRYATLKCQMQFGWDFAPRLRTCGIWDDVYLVVARSVFIEDARIKAEAKSEKSKVAAVSICLLLDSDREQDVRVVCVVRGKNFECAAQSFQFDTHLARGKQTPEMAFDLQDARAWNPWDRGDPNLYELQVVIARSEATNQSGLEIASPKALAMTQEEFLDSLATTFGIRSFTLARVEGAPPRAEPWSFVVNGAREFMRGANWVPLDAIPARLTRADYAARLQQARDANVNFLRVWGGGLREKRAFYDLCDEMGLLVWQEFPFAGAILDRFPSHRAFLNLVRDEGSAIVRALRNHPSLVVWCGGNEFNTRGNQAIVKTLRAIVKREDGMRPFKPASPYRDESHNWRVWHRFANLRDYRQDATPFLSEFGLQSMPNLESLKKFLPNDALFAPHRLWEYHHAELKKLGRYAQVASDEWRVTRGKEGKPASHGTRHSSHKNRMPVEEFVDATQRAQAIGLQIAIEHMRRRKGRAAGVAAWQFNDCWPAISWSVVDYYGAPKRAYEELQRLYAPVFASFDYSLQPRRAGDVVRGDLWLINDLRASFQNAELRAYLNGEEIYKCRVDIAPDSATRVDSLAVTLGAGGNILRLKVSWGPVTHSDHEYDLDFCDVGEIRFFDALLVAVGKRLMR
jgi:beta-mannosidase